MTRTLPRASHRSVSDPATATDAAPRARRRWLRTIVLVLGALAFLFPFYYMLVGSLQKKSDTSFAGAIPRPSNFSLHNYGQINAAINLGQTLLNSAIFTAGVVLGTVVFGILVGYALGQLHY